MGHFKLFNQADSFLLLNEDTGAYLQICCSADDGSIELVQEEDPSIDLSCKASNHEGLLGIVNLLLGPYLVMIEKSVEVADMPRGNGKIRLIKEIQCIPLMPDGEHLEEPPTKSEILEEENYLNMIRDVVQTQYLHFCYNEDLTQTLQRRFRGQDPVSSSKKSPQNMLEPDRRFFWNKHWTTPFASTFLHSWIQVATSGLFLSQGSVEVNSESVKVYLFCRRSCRRAGFRFHSRGLDKRGDVSNFAETECILERRDRSALAYVQVRASIPLYWTQQPTLRIVPRTKLFGENADALAIDWNELAFAKHFDCLSSLYGNVVAVCLVDRVGKALTSRDQTELGNRYAKWCKKYAQEALKFVWFDFHHECRKLQWNNLSKLLKLVEVDGKGHGIFHIDSEDKVVSFQKGVFRTNCLDSLDRTNVVQCLFARVALLNGLVGEKALEAHAPGSSPNHLKDPGSIWPLTSTYVDFEQHFKGMWADHADAISQMYSGTPALKTDFTRTGERTWRGRLQDAFNSGRRYIINNFYDGYRQDALDLFLGNYVPRRGRKKTHSILMQKCWFAMVAGQTIAVFASIVGISMFYHEEPSSVSALIHGLTIGASMMAAITYILTSTSRLSDLGSMLASKPTYSPNGYPEEVPP